MNTPHERLTRTTFSLPLGEVHALVGGAVNARPLLFLHGFPDHPPTAVPFLEHLAETHRVVAPWLRGYAPSPIVGPYDLDTLAADTLAQEPIGLQGSRNVNVSLPPPNALLGR
jgi:pimeloyl-ACP methyl ester carboxylesterase